MVFSKILSFFGKNNKDPRYMTRHISLGNKENYDVQNGRNFPKNKINSSKYTILTFIPKNLFEQFHRIANIYFLFVALIMLIVDTSVSPTSTLVPLVFVIIVTAIKQGYEDFLRHRTDKEINNQLFKIVKDGQLNDIQSKNIRVGNLIQVRCNQDVPCDLLLLATSGEEGQCFITTVNLDGETNLKTYTSISQTSDKTEVNSLGSLVGRVECEQPHSDLYNFVGKMCIDNENEFSLSASNLLLRGTRLKNTEFIYGCAVYTGPETKIYLNGRTQTQKYSRVEKSLNKFLVFYIIVLIIACSLWVVITFVFYENNDIVESVAVWYIDYWPSVNASEAIKHFFMFLVLFNYIIPISMYVSLEMIKFIGSIFFEYDLELYDPVMKQGVKANTSDLNEELGQIEYLFADKTGTLTKNEMIFRKFFVGKKYYSMGQKITIDKEDGVENNRGKNGGGIYGDEDGMVIDEFTVGGWGDGDGVEGEGSGGKPSVSSENETSSDDIMMMLESIALCHTAQIDKILEHDMEVINQQQKQQQQQQQRCYQASSPDEKALVETCAEAGVVFEGMKDKTITLSYNNSFSKEKDNKNNTNNNNINTNINNNINNNINTNINNKINNNINNINTNNNTNNNTTKEFILHHVLHFDSTRKKMSVLIEERDHEGQIKYKVICKGADSTVLETVTNGDVEAVEKSVNWFAKKGYRTLVYAYKNITHDEFNTYNQALIHANMQLENRNENVLQAYTFIETNLTVLGSTAIEDQLQDQVSQTIKALRTAGIQVWVLTGDKEETAKNVSSMAGHLTNKMTMYHVTRQTDRDICHDKMTSIMDDIKNKDIKFPALIVDGNSFTHATADEKVQDIFRTLCCLCCSVLGCRLSPIQKAQVVKMMKNSPSKPITAAVGDGANDVSMIHEAHVGIGIMGKEGKQAAGASDIAICSFFHLRRIFLVYGQYFYTRLAITLLYFFYKNVVLTGCQIFFTIHNGYSGQTFFTSFYLLFYNQTFTALPILIYGIFEKHIPEEVLYRVPVLYRKLRKNQLLNKYNFLKWNLLGLYHSLLAFYGVMALISLGHSFFPAGYSIGFLDAGCMTMMVVVLVVNIKLMLVSYYFNIIFLIGYIISIGMFYVLILFNDGILTPSLPETVIMHWTMFMLLSAPAMWFLKLLLVITSLLPDMLLRSFADSFKSSYIATVIFKSQIKASKYDAKNDCLVSVVKLRKAYDNEAFVE